MFSEEGDRGRFDHRREGNVREAGRDVNTGFEDGGGGRVKECNSRSWERQGKGLSPADILTFMKLIYFLLPDYKRIRVLF